ncbi:MAG: FHA domain-containing protein, partial [Burkholderiales bacterium]|nr:FHA domain-containing protein [Phycisphaerae bacterium]
MQGILFIDLGEVRTFEIDGPRTIGRDAKNDIVVTHPTVSRHHARIEVVDGTCRVIDFNSRNGTRVNGRAISGGHPLIDGARMRIGHVRAWFFSTMPSKLPRSITNRDRGIVFMCDCGQRLWSSSDTCGMAVTCGGCHKSIEVPGQTQSLEEDLGGTVSGVTVAPDDTQPDAVVCGVCQWPVEKADRKHACPACGIEFHLDCWRENKGCSAYGCSQVNALVPKQRPATPIIADEPAAIESVIATAPEPVVFAWAHALLAMGVIGSLIGLLSFGIPPAIVALVAVVRMLVARTDSRAVLGATMFIAVLGAGAGV